MTSDETIITTSWLSEVQAYTLKYVCYKQQKYKN